MWCSAAGETLTNMSVFDLPRSAFESKCVSRELRNGTCFDLETIAATRGVTVCTRAERHARAARLRVRWGCACGAALSHLR